jgi:hypothetical protein
VNRAKILGNAAVAFFTVLAAVNLSGDGDTSKQLLTAFWGALVQGGLAAALEIKAESERKGGPVRKLRGVLLF